MIGFQGNKNEKLLFVFFIFIAGAIFGQEIGILNQLKGYLGEPVPANAQRMNRTEYSRLLSSSEISSLHEIFEVIDGTVIMASLKMVGQSSIADRYFGSLFDRLEPLGEPVTATRTDAVWIDNGFIVILQYTAHANNESSVLLYVLTEENFELFRRIMR